MLLHIGAKAEYRKILTAHRDCIRYPRDFFGIPSGCVRDETAVRNTIKRLICFNKPPENIECNPELAHDNK